MYIRLNLTEEELREIKRVLLTDEGGCCILDPETAFSTQKLEEKGEIMPESKKEAIVRLCTAKPRTVDDIQAEFPGANYHTVYRAVKELEEAKVLEKLPFRRGKKLIYQPTGKEYQGKLRVQVRETMMPLVRTGLVNSRDVPGELGQIVSYLWVRSFNNTRGEAGELDQSYVQPVEAKQDLGELRRVTKELTNLIDQLLLSPIWDDSDGLHERMGDVNTKDVVTLQERARQYMISKRDK